MQQKIKGYDAQGNPIPDDTPDLPLIGYDAQGNPIHAAATVEEPPAPTPPAKGFAPGFAERFHPIDAAIGGIKGAAETLMNPRGPEGILKDWYEGEAKRQRDLMQNAPANHSMLHHVPFVGPALGRAADRMRFEGDVPTALGNVAGDVATMEAVGATGRAIPLALRAAGPPVARGTATGLESMAGAVQKYRPLMGVGSVGGGLVHGIMAGDPFAAMVDTGAALGTLVALPPALRGIAGQIRKLGGESASKPPIAMTAAEARLAAKAQEAADMAARRAKANEQYSVSGSPSGPQGTGGASLSVPPRTPVSMNPAQMPPSGLAGASPSVLQALIAQLPEGKLPFPEGPQGLSPRTLQGPERPAPSHTGSGMPANIPGGITSTLQGAVREPALSPSHTGSGMPDAGVPAPTPRLSLTADPAVLARVAAAKAREAATKPAPVEGRPITSRAAKTPESTPKPTETSKSAESPAPKPKAETKPKEPTKAPEPSKPSGWDPAAKEALKKEFANSKGQFSEADVEVLDKLEAAGVKIDDAGPLVKEARANRGKALYERKKAEAAARPAPSTAPIGEQLQAELARTQEANATNPRVNPMSYGERVAAERAKVAAEEAAIKATREARLKASGGSFAGPQGGKPMVRK